MTAWIQRWTPKFEFSIITAIVFIMPFIGSLLILINQKQSSFFSDHRLFRTIIFETIILLVIGLILYIRDFDVRHLHLNPSWRLTVQGVLLYLVTALASGVAAMIVVYLYPAAGSYLSSLHHGRQNIVTTLSLSIINPLYEELLLVGYVIATLDKFTSTTRAMVTSVSIRATCHFYQGPAGVAGVVVMGIIFAYFFIRKRQLWPLIVAHGIWDFLGLMAVTRT